MNNIKSIWKNNNNNWGGKNYVTFEYVFVSLQMHIQKLHHPDNLQHWLFKFKPVIINLEYCNI